MTLAQWQTWQKSGRQWTVMRPIKQIGAKLAAHGYTVYYIGNTSHMLANPALDHTPFSQTGWPTISAYGVIHAMDVMPPSPGQKSKIDGRKLPSLEDLSRQLYVDKQDKVPGTEFLKYMNWQPAGFDSDDNACFHDSWKPDHERESSNDKGHLHASGRSDMDNSTLSDEYDLVARTRGEEEDMTPEQAEQAFINVLAEGYRAAKGEAAGDNAKDRRARNIRDYVKRLANDGPIDLGDLSAEVAQEVINGLQGQSVPDLVTVLRAVLTPDELAALRLQL